MSVEWHADLTKPSFCYGNPQDGNLWPCFFEPLSFPVAPAARQVARGYADAAMTYSFAYAMSA